MFNRCLRPCFFPLLTLLLLVATSEERCLMNHSLCSRKSKKIESNKGKFNESIFVDMKKATNMSRHAKTTKSSIYRMFKISGKMNMANTKASGRHKHGLKSMGIEHQSSTISDKSSVGKPNLDGLRQKTKKENFFNRTLNVIRKPYDTKKVYSRKNSNYGSKKSGKIIKSKNLNKIKFHRQLHPSAKKKFESHLNKSNDKKVKKNPIVLNLNDNKRTSLKGASNMRKLVIRCNLNTNNSGVNIPRNKRCMKLFKLRSKTIRDLKINNTQLFASYDKSKKLPRNIMNENFKQGDSGSLNTQIIYLDENKINSKEFLAGDSNVLSTNPYKIPVEVNEADEKNIETGISLSKNYPVQTLFYPQYESGTTYPTWVFKPNPEQPNIKRDTTNEIFSNEAADDNLPFIPQSTFYPLTEMSPPMNNFEIIQPATEKLLIQDRQQVNDIKDLKYFFPGDQSQVIYKNNDEINLGMQNVPQENITADIRHPNEFHNVFQPSENLILRERSQQLQLEPEIGVNDPEKVINLKNIEMNPEKTKIQRSMPNSQHSDVFIHQHGHQYLPPTGVEKHTKLNATTMSQIKKLLLSLKTLLHDSGSKAEVGEKHTDMSAKYSLVENNVGKAGELKLHQKKLHLDIKPDVKQDIHFKHDFEGDAKPEFEGDVKHEFVGGVQHEMEGGVQHEIQGGVQHEFAELPHDSKILEIVTHTSLSTSGQEVIATTNNNTSSIETLKSKETINCILAILGLLFVTAVVLTIYLAAIKYYAIRKTLKSDSQEKHEENFGWLYRISNNLSPEKLDEEIYDRMVEDNVLLKDILNRILGNMAFNSDSYLKICYSSRQHQNKLRKAMSGVIK